MKNWLNPPSESNMKVVVGSIEYNLGESLSQKDVSKEEEEASSNDEEKNSDDDGLGDTAQAIEKTEVPHTELIEGDRLRDEEEDGSSKESEDLGTVSDYEETGVLSGSNVGHSPKAVFTVDERMDFDKVTLSDSNPFLAGNFHVNGILGSVTILANRDLQTDVKCFCASDAHDMLDKMPKLEMLCNSPNVGSSTIPGTGKQCQTNDLVLKGMNRGSLGALEGLPSAAHQVFDETPIPSLAADTVSDGANGKMKEPVNGSQVQGMERESLANVVVSNGKSRPYTGGRLNHQSVSDSNLEYYAPKVVALDLEECDLDYGSECASPPPKQVLGAKRDVTNRERRLNNQRMEVEGPLPLIDAKAEGEASDPVTGFKVPGGDKTELAKEDTDLDEDDRGDEDEKKWSQGNFIRAEVQGKVDREKKKSKFDGPLVAKPTVQPYSPAAPGVAEAVGDNTMGVSSPISGGPNLMDMEIDGGKSYQSMEGSEEVAEGGDERSDQSDTGEDGSKSVERRSSEPFSSELENEDPEPSGEELGKGEDKTVQGTPPDCLGTGIVGSNFVSNLSCLHPVVVDGVEGISTISTGNDPKQVGEKCDPVAHAPKVFDSLLRPISGPMSSANFVMGVEFAPEETAALAGMEDSPKVPNPLSLAVALSTELDVGGEDQIEYVESKSANSEGSCGDVCELEDKPGSADTGFGHLEGMPKIAHW
ncbi:hypothetical protein U1Q18_036439 [Sarracenia purpurea var. burkii]